MNMMYEDEKTDAILLSDASKATNSLNRQSFLHNLYSSIAYSLKVVTALHQDFS